MHYACAVFGCNKITKVSLESVILGSPGKIRKERLILYAF
jgi:hypothetical protein